MKYYASKCHDIWHNKPFSPEQYCEGLMLNPKYPCTISNDVPYIIDSGAFQDVKSSTRISFEDALARQLKLEDRVGRMCEKLVSYDRLVDEQLRGGEQIKERVNEEIGWRYVDETIRAAKFLSSKREDLYPRKLILSCQGVTVDQYLSCASSVLDCADATDTFGIGGFCILSKNKKYKAQYLDVIERLFPMIAENGLKSVHIFGMSVFDVLIHTEHLAKRYGLVVSYDTSSAEVNSLFGKAFNPDTRQLNKVYSLEERYDIYHPTDLAHFNIRNISQFWENFEKMNMTNQLNTNQKKKGLQ